ncbi:g10868 [Coccomyxa elongata]
MPVPLQLFILALRRYLTSQRRAAYQHSLDMATQDYFSHTGSDGSGLEDRASNNNFYTFPLGENIAAGYISVQTTVLAWMCSPGHRQNLMGCGFDTVGTGAALNMTSAYKVYFTQDFGCSRDDFNCQCPEVVSPTTGQPVPTPPQPDCSTSPPPVAAFAQAAAAGGAKVPAPAPSSLPEAPTPAPQASTTAKATAPTPATVKAPTLAPQASASGAGSAVPPSPGVAARAAKPPAAASGSGPTTAPALAPASQGSSGAKAPATAGGNTVQTGGTPASATGTQATSPLAQATSLSGVPTSAVTGPSAAPSILTTAGLQASTAQSPVAVLAAEVPVSAAAVALNNSGGAGNALAGGPAAAAQRPLGIYATSMELPGSSGALAATNSPTAVIVASLGPFGGNLSVSDVSAMMQGGSTATVGDVQPFPDEPATYLIEVLHPKGFTGTVTVSLPKLPALQPLTYNVVSRDLVVQSLGFSICPLNFGTH